MERIGKYEIQAQIGHGGFGRVYRAFDPTVGRTVAIKVMLGSGGETDHELLRRFRVEASATGGLRHKNIVTVFDYGEYEGTPYLVIEYLEGRELYKIISDGPPLSLLDMVTIMDQVAEGLQHAHQSGVVHRDVKPANIMILNDGSVKIMDFGIARVKREQETRITQQGYLIGTVAYMAPEQFWGGEVDHRTDIFAYGVILFELIAGRHPFRPPRAESAQVMFNIGNINPPLVSSIVSGIPPELDQLIVRAIEKDRDSRYLTLEDLRFDLAPILQELKGRFVQDKVHQARGLFTGGKFDQAQELIREVLRHDASNVTARQLREEIQKLTKSKASREKSNQLAETAKRHLSAGDYSKAAENFEEALKLDSANTWIEPLLAQAKTAIVKAHRTAALMAAARRQLESDDLTGAQRIVTECLEQEPVHEEAGGLLRIILEKRERRIEEALSRAKALAVAGSYDEALSLLDDLAALYPDVSNIPRIAERLRARQQHDLEHRQSRETETPARPASEEIAAEEPTRRWDEARLEAERKPVRPETQSRPSRYKSYMIGGIAAGLLVAIALYFGLRGEERSSGVLQVSVLPAGASVVVNGQSCQKAECRFELPKATYELQARLAGYRLLQVPVTINGKNPPLRLALTGDPVRLHVSTNFEAGKIMMDGSVAGVLEHGEFILEDCPLGKHTLEVSAADGAYARIRFEVTPAAPPKVLSAVEVNNVVALALSRLGRQAQIMSDGKARAVLLDGREVGQLGATPIALENLPDSARELKLDDGSRTLGFPVSPQDKPALNIFLRANRDVGLLLVEAHEPDAAIFVNGRVAGRTAASGTFQTSLPTGDYQVLVEKPGFKPGQLQKARIARDSVRQVGFRLEPKPAERIIAERLTGTQVPEPKALKTDRPLVSAPDVAAIELKQVELLQNSSDVAALEQFRREFPQSAYLDTVSRRIESLEWDKARTSKEAIEAFLLKYPRSARREVAERILAQLEKDRLDRLRADAGRLEQAAREKADAQSLLQTLQQLSAAYASKDGKEIGRLYPSVSKQFLNSLRKDVQSVSMQLRVVGSPQMTPEVATAQVERQVATLFKGESKARTESDRVTITLRRVNGGWIVESMK